MTTETQITTNEKPAIDTTVEERGKVGAPPMMIAQTPDQMIKAQAHLVEFMVNKIAAEGALLAEKEDNLAAARRAKIRTVGWKKEVTIAKGRVRYYTNVLEALKEGYCIVPDFPVGLIAVRTNRTKPKSQYLKRFGWTSPDDVPAAALPKGDGRYVSPEPDIVLTSEEEDNGEDAEGKPKTKTVEYLETCGFKEVDMPIRLVKPQIINELNRAMTLRLFDEIGVLPSAAADKRIKSDPMLIGRIRRKEGGKAYVANFLITWWIDPETI